MILEYYLPKGVAVSLYYPAYDGEWSSQYVTSPTGLDSEASIDKAAFSDCTNEWTEIGSSGVGYLDLTAGEMDNGEIVVQTKSSTAGVNFPLVVIHTYTDTLIAAQSALATMPSETSSLEDKINWLFARLTHKEVVDTLAGTTSIYKSDGTTVLGVASISDDGNAFTRAKVEAPA